MKKKELNKKSLAISQILILLLGTVAVSYALGSSIGFVSGLTVKGEFTYGLNNINFVIESQTKIVQKNNPEIQYLYDIKGASNCRTKWFWDINGDGSWGTAEETASQNVCMLEGFVAAMQGAKIPGAELPEGEEETGGAPPSAINPSFNPFPPGTTAWLLFKGSFLPEKEETEEKTERSYEVLEKVLPEEPKEKLGDAAKIATGQILKDAGVALIISAGVEYFKDQLMEWGLSEGQVEALQTGAALAYFIGKIAYRRAEAGKLKLFGTGKLGTFLSENPAWAGIGVGAIIMGITLIVMRSRKGEQKLVTFECVPWQSITGGNDCDECNKQGILPCSEYQCRSLGQGCQLLNEPGSAEALCVWVDRGDSEYPTIRALDSALIENEYDYRLQNTGISPPDRGAVIEYIGEKDTTSIIIGGERTKCVPAFTPLRFGITTFDKDNKEGEPAICKIDPVRKENFDEMNFYMGGSSTFKYNHTQTLSLPGPDALAEEGIEITTEGGIQEFYIRCQDANGNSNPAAFVFKFCVDEGPDETPPEIVTTDLINNMPFAYGQDSIDVNVYINEPAECKWSHSDQPYENMENDMEDCATSLSLMNAQGLFTCATTLDGLKDGVKNRFYFRCQDLQGNTNKDSYEFVLLGSQPLVINSVSPNKTTVKDSTDPVKVTIEVKTSAGYNEGEATCYYKKGDEEEKDFVQFSETVSYQHSHDLWLPGEPGGKSYTYDIKCIDLGGNADYSTISFEVETDIEAPVVVRAYHEDTYLKIVTNEKAECVYDVTNCNYNFDDGIPMESTDDGISHFIDWNTKLNFYIKCRDQYGKEPNPNECSITVRPLQIL